MSKIQQALLAGLAFGRAHWRELWLHGPRLKRYQERRASQIVAWTSQHAPFYREHWRGHDLRHWQQLPEVNKQLMMDHFQDFNTHNISAAAALEVALRADRERRFSPTLHGLTVGLSSGTSGHRGLFLVAPEEQSAWAGTIIARSLWELRREPYRVAFFLRANSNLYQRVNGRLIAFEYFDLLEPLEATISRLNQMQPQIIVGPPSLLAMLATARQRGQLRCQPERLISVAEVLEPQDQQQLEAAFEAPVGQIYQCTEGLLAISCPAGRLHIQEDLVALQLEPLDAAGTRWTPLVTDLWRRAQPIIRYRLNDVLRIDPRACPCGCSFRVLAAIEGRRDDCLRFVRVDGSERQLFPDAIRRMVLHAGEPIQDYQAIQDRPNQLQLFLEAADFPAAAAAVERHARQLLAEAGVSGPSIGISAGLPALALGVKRRRVWRREQAQ